jgi:hypothetical protein
MDTDYVEPDGQHRDGVEYLKNTGRSGSLIEPPPGHSTGIESINLRGVFRFAVDRHADQIQPSRPNASITGTNE